MFEVDPLWPKPLPNHWVVGSTIGVWADAQDHVWIIPSGLDAFRRRTAPGRGPAQRRVLRPGPTRPRVRPGRYPPQALGRSRTGVRLAAVEPTGIFVDHMENVWIGGNGGGDSHVLKFTKDGTFLKQFGLPNARLVAGTEAEPRYTGGSNDPENYGRVAKIFVDPNTNEAYLADGYLNKRVAVLDGETGVMKRHWGAYGNTPDDSPAVRYDLDAEPPQQFGTPVHCADLSNDGLVYVCDRPQNRIQVFTAGRRVREGEDHPEPARVRVGLGHRLLAGSGAAVPLPGRRHERQDPHLLA